MTLRRGTPGELGYTVDRPLEVVGRARAFALAGNEAAARSTLLRLDHADLAVAERLIELGRSGLGAVVDGGLDPEGPWIVRRAPRTTLARELKERERERGGASSRHWPWRTALDLCLAIARALTAAERVSLFPGPLSPDTVGLDGELAVLPADDLVLALLGRPQADRAAAQSGAPPLWTPPAQADGAAWDSEANRYALGLILYRLLAGEHAFGGAGLRHALAEAQHREAAPFVESIASTLPSGLMSFVLRMVHPDPGRRPESAREIAERLQSALRGDATAGRAQTLPSGPAAERPRAQREPEARGGPARAPRVPSGRRAALLASAWARRSWPLAIGVGVAIAAFAQLAPKPTRPAKTASVAAAAPLTASQTAATDCASCHPRQAAEWRRSVMAHSVKSPLFNALESLIQEQVGRDVDCPNGAGILRKTNGAVACRDRQTGLPVSGSGGEHWCVNCHSPADNLGSSMPVWEGRPGGSAASRLPVRDLLGDRALEGISCGFCHQVHGPVGRQGSGGYEGNPTWTSFVTGQVYPARPEDRAGVFGIANSGYDLRPEAFLSRASDDDDDLTAHARPSDETRAYLASSRFCGSCHDVRLFGTDVFGARKGEHFKRLRNAYSEWADWGASERAAGRTPASCQDCHMSTFPGVCVPGEEDSERWEGVCPPGTRFERRAPGERGHGLAAVNSPELTEISTHYFSGVDLPLSPEYPDEILDEDALDADGTPLSPKRRRDLLLRASMQLRVEGGAIRGGEIEVPIIIENVGAGHRVPAGFSQEREIWVHLQVTDARGRPVYEVGRVNRDDEDLADKIFLRVNTDPDRLDGLGRPVGMFGADVRDGPDVPRWSPPPDLGGTQFRGRGLINFQNGFLRCVTCIGELGPDGTCRPGPGQGFTRADRFADGDYDIDTGECRSNLFGHNALFETYFPVGALDADRGLPKAPDAIIDTRSLPPGVPIRYVYEIPTRGARGPFRVEARLLFRAFPPFLIRAFAEYERLQAARGRRPSGPLVTLEALDRLEVVELARAEVEVR